jgi:hypothetical protein
MASGTTNLTVNEAAYGRTAYYKFDYLDLQTPGFLSSGAGGFYGAANQVILDFIEPGEMATDVTVQVITAAAGDTDWTFDVGTQDKADPDNLLDNVALGTKAAKESLSSVFGSDALSRVISNNTDTKTSLLMEFVNLTPADLTAGEWVIAWRVITAPIEYVQS